MAKLPLDVNAVLGAATDIDAARQMPVRVALLVDPDAGADLAAAVRRAFATANPQATVVEHDFTVAGATVQLGTDCAVVVSDASGTAGAVSSVLLADGVPAVVVTRAPETLRAACEQAGFPLLEDDVVSPHVPAAQRGAGFEPYELDAQREAALLERLGEWVVATFKRKRLAFALSFSFVRRPLAKNSIGATSVQNAAIGLVPLIPGADMPLMTMNQAKMVLQIAAAFGLDVGAARWRELLAVTGGAFAGREAARRAIAAVPVLGAPIRLGVGYAGTRAMGEAALAWFQHQADGTYELPDEQPAGQRVREGAQRVVDAVRPYGAWAAAAASELAQGVGEVAVGAAEHARPATKQVADAVAPRAEALWRAVRPQVGRAVGAVAPRVAEAAGRAVPWVRDTVRQYCREQGIDPAEFASQMASAFARRAKRG